MIYFSHFGAGSAEDPGPYEFTVPGKDAESGVGDWTQIEGGPLATRSGIGGLTGNCFVGAENAGISVARHGWYDIPSSHFTVSDAGNLQVTLEIPYITLNTDSDYAAFAFEYYDDAGGAGNFLGYSRFPDTGAEASGYNSDSLATLSLVGKVPAGTRSLTFAILAGRQSGSELSFYFEINSLTLTVGPTYRSSALFSDYKADVTSALTGWTTTTGSITGACTMDAQPFTFAQRHGGSQARLTYNKALTIPAVALVPIAAGLVTARLKRAVFSTNANDASRTFCEFLDAGESVVATLQDAATADPWTTVSTFAEYTVAVPTTAVSARMNFDFVRNDGAVLDARVREAEVLLEW